jgi:hypothetical protein
MSIITNNRRVPETVTGTPQSKDFRGYIEGRRVTETTQGDFTREAKADTKLPNARTWQELRLYLDSVSARDEVYDAALSVWLQYRTRYPKRDCD